MPKETPRSRRMVPLNGEMGVVTVQCPITLEEVSTGIVIKPLEFVVVDFEDQRFRCDACGEIHTWDRQVAYYHHQESV